jgi:hypothetical protein
VAERGCALVARLDARFDAVATALDRQRRNDAVRRRRTASSGRPTDATSRSGSTPSPGPSPLVAAIV